MGVYLIYRSTESLDAKREAAIRAAAEKFDSGFSWLFCDSVSFDDDAGDNRLTGSSKLNLQPHPEDRAAALASGLPDGTVKDLFEALCEISREHQVNWEVKHDMDSAPIGYIRHGVIDDDLDRIAEGFEEAGAYLADFDLAECDSESFTDESYDEEDD